MTKKIRIISKILSNAWIIKIEYPNRIDQKHLINLYLKGIYHVWTEKK